VKKVVFCLLGMALAAGALMPVFGGEAPSAHVELTGWITDEWCGARNANADGGDCARSCAEKGANLVLYTGDGLYKLSDKKTALEHVGYKVTVKGTLEEDTLNVISIARARDDA